MFLESSVHVDPGDSQSDLATQMMKSPKTQFISPSQDMAMSS